MEQLKAFWKEEDGIGIIELILILVILIMIIVIFREQIVGIVTKAFKQISGDAKKIQTEIKLE